MKRLAVDRLVAVQLMCRSTRSETLGDRKTTEGGQERGEGLKDMTRNAGCLCTRLLLNQSC